MPLPGNPSLDHSAIFMYGFDTLLAPPPNGAIYLPQASGSASKFRRGP